MRLEGKIQKIQRKPGLFGINIGAAETAVNTVTTDYRLQMQDIVKNRLILG